MNRNVALGTVILALGVLEVFQGQRRLQVKLLQDLLDGFVVSDFVHCLVCNVHFTQEVRYHRWNLPTISQDGTKGLDRADVYTSAKSFW